MNNASPKLTFPISQTITLPKTVSSMGSLLSPIAWEWLKQNWGVTYDGSHIANIAGYRNLLSQFFYNSYWY